MSINHGRAHILVTYPRSGELFVPHVEEDRQNRLDSPYASEEHIYMRTLVAMALLCLLTTTSAHSQSADIDVHNDVVSANTYYVTFATRQPSASSTFGHAMIIWTKEDASTKTSSEEAYGFYAGENSVRGYTGSVPGVILDEAKSKSGSNISSLASANQFLRIRVDEQQFNSARKEVIDGLRRATSESPEVYSPAATGNGAPELHTFITGGKNYLLVLHDCVGMLASAGESLGLKMPDRNLITPGSWVPRDYLAATIKAARDGALTNHPSGGSAAVDPAVRRTKGTLSYNNGAKYSGEIVDGRPDGRGKFTDTDGATFEGDYKQGAMQTGTLTMADGVKFSGTFHSAEMQKGVLTDPATGTTFDGTFANKKMARGTMTYSDGAKVTGDFSSGRPEGDARIDYSDGDRYEGQLHGWRPDGKGLMTFSDGTTIAGAFAHSFSDGVVECQFPDGAKYAGGIKKGTFSGHGTYSDKGGTFEGAFDGGKLTGRGSYTAGDGSRVAGIFKEGKLDGAATWTSPQGDRVSVEYSNGALKAPPPADSNGAPKAPAPADSNGSQARAGVQRDGDMRAGMERVHSASSDAGEKMRVFDSRGHLLGERPVPKF